MNPNEKSGVPDKYLIIYCVSNVTAHQVQYFVSAKSIKVVALEKNLEIVMWSESSYFPIHSCQRKDSTNLSQIFFLLCLILLL
jgi:hypothetical protein